MRPIVLSVLSGILFALALPPFDVEVLGWVALVPLFVAIATPDRRVLHAVGLGLLTGIVTGVVQVRNFGEQQGFHFAVLPFIWIGLMFALIAGIAAFMRLHLTERPALWVLFVALSGTVVEWLTTFSPLPVGVVLCQFRNLPILQLASLTGMWGISFLLYLMNAGLADALLRRRFEKVHAAVLGTVLIAFLVGGKLLKFEEAWPRKTLMVAAVQDYTGYDVPPSEHALTTGNEPDTEHLMRNAVKQGAELIVGTEESLGAGFQPNDLDDAMAKLARESGTHLIVGYEGRDGKGDRNVTALIDPTGHTVATHNKVQLFLGERTRFVAGEGATVTDTALGRIGLFICFDTCFPTLVREAALQKAQILAVPNYDPPTVNAILHHLHGAILPFRAVEHRIAIVRADPNGNSQIIEPSGKLVAEGPMYRAVSVTALAAIGDGTGTLYTRLGDWFAYVCVLGSLLIGFLTFRKTSPQTS